MCEAKPKLGNWANARQVFRALTLLVSAFVFKGTLAARPAPQQVHAPQDRVQSVATAERTVAAAQSPPTASAPAPAGQATPPQESPPRAKGISSRLPNWRALLILMGAIALSSLGAAMRVVQKFRSFSGLSIFSNWYSWCFVGLVGLLSGFAYVGLTGLESLVVKAQDILDPGFIATKMAGAAGVAQALVALGRLGRPRAHPVPPGEVSPWQDVPSANLVLDFFYSGIRNHITEKMNLRTESLAQEFDWKTIREVTCRLLEDVMAVGGPEAAERASVVEKIRAIPTASDPDQDFDNRYTALVWTIARASYSQLDSRLSRKKPGAIE